MSRPTAPSWPAGKNKDVAPCSAPSKMLTPSGQQRGICPASRAAILPCSSPRVDACLTCSGHPAVRDRTAGTPSDPNIAGTRAGRSAATMEAAHTPPSDCKCKRPGPWTKKVSRLQRRGLRLYARRQNKRSSTSPTANRPPRQRCHLSMTQSSRGQSPLILNLRFFHKHTTQKLIININKEIWTPRSNDLLPTVSASLSSVFGGLVRAYMPNSIISVTPANKLNT